MERVLGTSFKAITRGLAKHWKLGDTLEKALYPGKDVNEKVQAVVLGERMSRAALAGWDSAAVKKVCEEIARYTYLPAEQCLQNAMDTAEKAAEVALQFGAVQVCPLIPGKNHIPVEAEGKTHTAKILKADAQLQLNILRELSAVAADNGDVNTLFQMVVEGMHRGIGIERVAIAFIHKHRCKAKYVLGEGTDAWRQQFDFDVGPYSENIFVHAIESDSAVWLDNGFISEHRKCYSKDIVQLLGEKPCFIAAIRLNGRTPALFYADRSDYGGNFTQEQYEAFRHFASQAQLTLNLISSKPAAR